MKTKLPRQEFQDALAAMATLTGGRTTKPILSCVSLRAEGDSLELSATDGEAALKVRMPALVVSQPGQAIVPADRLLSIIRELSDVEVALSADDRYCDIVGSSSKFKIFVQNPADFPPIPGFEDGPDLVVDGAQLWRMIGLTIYAAARETSRFAINGVLWEKQGKRLFLVATDGRRLARAGGPLVESSSADFQAIIPAKALAVFERVFAPGKGSDPWAVDIKVMPNQVILRSGDRVLSTVLVEGHFPKYQDVIPRGGDKKARADRMELFAAVRRAALLTTEESRAVKLAFGGDSLVITSQSPEQGEARVEVPVEYKGSPLEIGFNPGFLSDALKAMNYPQVGLELSEPSRPGILLGDDANEFLYVVMPVSLSS